MKEMKDIHEYVDLGLPSGTLWATCNVGAITPEGRGSYFAWGETEPQTDSYNSNRWETYKHCKGTHDTLTKYCIGGAYGIVDYKTELEPLDDAATVNWGSDWQMPSEEQCKELFNRSYTTPTRMNLNGVYGWLIVSRVNANSIFLPDTHGPDCNYWTRSLVPHDRSSKDAVKLWICGGYYDGIPHDARYCRFSVRPVRVKGARTHAVKSITLSKTEVSLWIGEAIQLLASVFPWYATSKKIQWECSNKDVATVNDTGKVTAVAVGNCIITCSATDGSGVKAEFHVKVVMNETHEYVDLGLPSGTLWATCNVGASGPEEYGDYYAWGEIKPKTTYYWSTYKYCKGSAFTLTKYCTSSGYGTVDNKTELEPSDDTATVNWGSGWQMPSLEQCAELFNSNYTTTTWTTLNGKYGRKITSKSNGNSIFLPAAGFRFGTSLGNAGSYGYYWSRSLSASNSRYAYELYFNSSGFGTNGSDRYCGQSVRPVRVKK